jgi:hypothetical protein
MAMWRTAATYLVLASLGLNLAFVGVWVAHAWPVRAEETPQQPSAIWCPLHRALAVSTRQWAEIEPRLREFQAKVGKLCQQVDQARSEVIEMIAAKEPDREAIRRKQDEILAAKRAIQGLVVEHLLAEKEFLTQDQQTRLFEILRQRTACTADPPMSGRGMGRGIGQTLRPRADP